MRCRALNSRLNMQRRLNLFRQLQGFQRSSGAWSLPDWVLLAVGVSWILYLGLEGYQFRIRSRSLKDSIQSSQKKLEEVSQSIQQSPARHSASEDLAQGEGWTLFVWKLSTLTGDHVVLRKIGLGETNPANPATKKVVIEGDATSLWALKEWLGRLIAQVPQYDFSIDQQAQSVESSFPVQFKVTAIRL